MAQRQKNTAPDTNTLPDLPPEFSDEQLAIADKIAADQLSMPVSLPESPFATTPDYCREMVALAIEAIVAGFTTLENRVLGDNGKQYPLDATLPAGVEDTGEVVIVNRYRYLAEQISNAVVWKLERELDKQNERVAAQRIRIRDAVRSYEAGRVDEAFLNRACDILEDIEEQSFLVSTAFDAAKDAFMGATGVEFETNAMRADKKRGAEAAAKELGGAAGTGIAARAAALLAKG